MKNKKIIVGVAALVVGFLPSFFFWRNFNQKNNNGASSASTGSTSGPAASAGGQQASMGQVQEIIAKAKQNPKDFDAQIAAAQAYNQIGRSKEVLEYLLQADQADSSRSAGMEIPYNIGSFYFQEKNYDKAQSWFEKQLKAQPDDAETTIELGATYLERQPPEPDKAMSFFQSVLDKNPKNTHALFHLTQAYLLKKDTASAEGALNKIKAAEPTNQNISGLQAQIEAVKAGQPVNIE